MMVRMCFLTGVLTMIFILKSCIFSGCEKIRFSQEDLSWYKSLPNEGDTLFFKGSDNTIDTFLISNKFNEFTDCNRFELGKYQYEEFRCTGVMLNVKGKNNNFESRFDIFFWKESQNDSISSCKKSIRFFNLHAVGITSLDEFNNDAIYIPSLKKKISTFLIKESIHTKLSSSTIRVKNYNWNKEYGLVRYMTEDSVVYEYWKKR